MTYPAQIRRRTAESPVLLTELPAFLARIYANRGIKDARELSCSLSDLLPYHGLKGIDAAVDVLAPMLMAQKRFLIIGDFDADGATATSVGVRALKMLGAKHVDFLVPNRFEYGYGLTPEIVVEAAKRNPDVIITVDNGISSIEGVAHANALGIPVVVTDHHLAGRELPQAAAIVNPNQPGCTFPSKALAGVGVIFYVMLALRARLRELNVFEGAGPNLAELLDIVAMGTVADLVPLDQNNRILVKQGLLRIRKGHACPGIQALLKVAGREPSRVNAQDFGFALGPRLNAAGRLEDMSIGIACLLSETMEAAMPLAEALDTLNGERKNIEADMQAQAESLLKKITDAPMSGLPLGLALYDPTWHVGVVGILASRVKEAHHRPVICFAKGTDGLLKGSARSVSGVHIRDVLDRVSTENPGLILKFGGHAMAAGLTIEEAGYEPFCKAFAQTVALFLKEEECLGVHWSDGALEPHEITLETARVLDLAGPFGAQFPAPLFDNVFTVVSTRPMSGDKHMRYMLAQPGRPPVEAVHFGVKPGNIAAEGQEVQIAYSLELNHFRGDEKLQLRVVSLNQPS
jgi:single-stranded-DNA-specific exonuclease